MTPRATPVAPAPVIVNVTVSTAQAAVPATRPLPAARPVARQANGSTAAVVASGVAQVIGMAQRYLAGAGAGGTRRVGVGFPTRRPTGCIPIPVGATVPVRPQAESGDPTVCELDPVWDEPLIDQSECETLDPICEDVIDDTCGEVEVEADPDACGGYDAGPMADDDYAGVSDDLGGMDYDASGGMGLDDGSMGDWGYDQSLMG